MGAARIDEMMLRRAALAGLRGSGFVEPNPMVGCVVGTTDGRVLGTGHHRRYGGAHAEVEALAACHANGYDPRGATAWVTLEPCDHQGKTGPCTRALLEAGIVRVVAARRDPNPVAAGGAERLRAAGVACEFSGACAMATRLADPWEKRLRTGLPWVIAKWAQSIDGKIATRAGESKWISCATSRRMVHRLRGRMDAVVTGIGTVLADDPLLTARGVATRRVARRVVVDPSLRIPMWSALVRSAREVPLTVACGVGAVGDEDGMKRRDGEKIRALRAAGVDVLEIPAASGRLALDDVLRWLVSEHDVTNVMVEAGPGLVGSLMSAGLVDEMLVFVGSMVLGDEAALGPARVEGDGSLGDARRWELAWVKRVGVDVVMRYRMGRRGDGGETG